MLRSSFATLKRKAAPLCARLDRFVRDGRAVSSIEFAIIAPLMITIYLGGVEVTQAVTADRKTTLVARTIADLVSQYTSISDSQMNDILNASATVASPFPVANLQVVVSSVTIDSTGKAKIDWSDTLNGTKRTVGQVISLPSALAIPGSSLIWGEVYYNYKPAIGYVITGNLTMYDQIYMKPRQSSCVNRPTTETNCTAKLT